MREGPAFFLITSGSGIELYLNMMAEIRILAVTTRIIATSRIYLILYLFHTRNSYSSVASQAINFDSYKKITRRLIRGTKLTFQVSYNILISRPCTIPIRYFNNNRSL